MFCSNCGNQLPENAAVCPYCRAQLRRPTPVETPVVRTPFPGFSLGFGIAAVVFGFIAYVTSILSGSSVMAFWTVLTFLLGIAGIIFGALGLRRSIRTGGRKYVAGIVLSAIGLACSVGGIVFAFLGTIIRMMVQHF